MRPGRIEAASFPLPALKKEFHPILQSARTLVFLCSCALANGALAEDVAVLHA